MNLLRQAVLLPLCAGLPALIAPAAQAGCGEYNGQIQICFEGRCEVQGLVKHCSSAGAGSQWISDWGISWGTQTRSEADTRTSKSEDSTKCFTAAIPTNLLGASRCVETPGTLAAPVPPKPGPREQQTIRELHPSYWRPKHLLRREATEDVLL